MVDDLLSKFGGHGAVAILGIPWITIRLREGRRFAPDAGSRRAIWLVWCMAFHPEWLGSLEDLVTGGRLGDEPIQAERLAAKEWSDWSI
jgi:hypothetical protein